MVVTAAVTTGRHGRKGSSLFCATVLLAGIAIAPTPTQSAGSSSVGSPSSPFTLRRKPLRFDLVGPSRFNSHFFSLSSSYGPMSVIAPTVYGDFRSPSYQAWSPSTGSGVQPMSETEGGDPAVTTMFDTLKVGLLPGAGSAGAVVDSNAAVSTIPTISGAAGMPTISGAGGMPTISGAGGIPNISGAVGTQPVCSDDQLARGLEAGGKYWNVQGLLAKPEQFLPGMATGIGVGNPMGGLGRSGNQSNVAQPGPAGGWCRPAPERFWQSSPLESPFLWTGVAALLVGVVVFWLSRGIKIPPARSGHFNHARVLPGDRP